VQTALVNATYPDRSIWNDCNLFSAIPPFIKVTHYEIKPNPSTGIVYITRSNIGSSSCYYSVYDYTGKLLIQRIFPQGNRDLRIDLNRYNKGIYLLKITDGPEVFSEKIIKE
jgi:hypothetical protein